MSSIRRRYAEKSGNVQPQKGAAVFDIHNFPEARICGNIVPMTSAAAGKRVLILSTSAGSGHVKAAEALEKVFRENPQVDEVRHLDALDFTNKVFRDFYSKLYTTLVREAPTFLGWWYKKSDEPWRTDASRQMIDRLNTRNLVKEIESFRPDITVCTHFMPAGIMSHLIAESRVEAHLSIVVTDFDFHAMWLSRAFHRYFVAIDETRAHLAMLGLPEERITVSGIPIDPVFLQPVDRAATLREFAFAPTRPTILLSAGALGLGPTEFAVEQLLKCTGDFQTIVLCGKDEELQLRVREIVRPGNSRFHVMGYSDRMHELMKSADLFIGKPGGLTTAEALASELPMVIVSPIPGQEERNSDHLLENGIAVKCNDLVTLPYKVDRLLAEPGRLANMRRNTHRLARADAAKRVVDTLIDDDLPFLELDQNTRAAIAHAAGVESNGK
jgi:processive 1,2-diacylglycerol beta-glucosyltransferase